MLRCKHVVQIGLYLERRVGKNFARREYGHLRVAIQILYALLQVRAEVGAVLCTESEVNRKHELKEGGSEAY